MTYPITYHAIALAKHPDYDKGFDYDKGEWRVVHMVTKGPTEWYFRFDGDEEDALSWEYPSASNVVEALKTLCQAKIALVPYSE